MNFSSTFNKKILNNSLLEVKRSDILNKSKNADNYKDTSKGKNRFERRVLSRVPSNIANYNKIDMDSLFKRDVLVCDIDVKGETDTYTVVLRFSNVLKELASLVKSNKGILTFNLIYRALMKTLNNQDVHLKCNCPDFAYRFAYWANKNKYGIQYEPRAAKITNPNDSKGAGCKHILLLLGNISWIVKIAAIINNYIKFIKSDYQSLYADYVFPKIYGMPYKHAVMRNMFTTGLLPSDVETMKDVANKNAPGRDVKTGKFVKKDVYKKEPDEETEEENK